MMERSPQVILFLGIFLTALSSVDARVKSVYVFGDSQFDPGNNQYIKNCTLQANFRPYGSSFFHHPTGRFTNGRTVADFIALLLGIKFQRPYQEVHRHLSKGIHLAKNRHRRFPNNGINFASGGSGLLRLTNKNAKVTPIQVQLQQFESLIAHNHIHKNQTSKSMFFLGAGGNDIFSYFLYPGASKLRPRTYVRAMLREMVHSTSIIYKHGGRRFALFSIGPMGCLPSRVLIRGANATHCIDKMDLMVKYYNTGLKRFVSRIPRMFPGAIGVYGEAYNTVKKYRDNPKSYGLTDVTRACCGAGPLNGMLQCGLRGYTMCLTPNHYLFWDYFHPTERTYGLVAKDFWAGGKEEIWPMNLKALSALTRKHTLPIP